MSATTAGQTVQRGIRFPLFQKMTEDTGAVVMGSPEQLIQLCLWQRTTN